jgi:hypothetical protein
LKNGNSRSARYWLENEFGPGIADEIIYKIASGFWENCPIYWPKNKHGRVASGKLLLKWAESAGIKNIESVDKNQMPHIKSCEGGFELSIRIGKKKGNYKNTVRQQLELDPTARWDFAHEIGHTFFFNRTLNPPEKTYGSDESGEEYFCQRFASELLIPRKHIMQIVTSRAGITVELLVELAIAYGVPLTAIIRKLIIELDILKATCVTIDRYIAKSWAKRQFKNKNLPKKGIEVFAPVEAKFKLTEEMLLHNKVVNRVCSSGGYWNEKQTGQEGLVYVEGMILKDVAPQKGCIFLFHESIPKYVPKGLFDRF